MWFLCFIRGAFAEKNVEPEIEIDETWRCCVEGKKPKVSRFVIYIVYVVFMSGAIIGDYSNKREIRFLRNFMGGDSRHAPGEGRWERRRGSMRRAAAGRPGGELGAGGGCRLDGGGGDHGTPMIMRRNRYLDGNKKTQNAEIRKESKLDLYRQGKKPRVFMRTFGWKKN